MTDDNTPPEDDWDPELTVRRLPQVGVPDDADTRTNATIDPPTTDVPVADTQTNPIFDTAVRPGAMPGPTGDPVAFPPPHSDPTTSMPAPAGLPVVLPPPEPNVSAATSPMPAPSGTPVALPPPGQTLSAPMPTPTGAPITLPPPVLLPPVAPPPSSGESMPPPSSVLAPGGAVQPRVSASPPPPPTTTPSRSQGRLVALGLVAALVLVVGGAVLGVVVFGRSAEDTSAATDSAVSGPAGGPATETTAPSTPTTTSAAIVPPAQVAALDVPALANQLSLVERTILDLGAAPGQVAVAAHTEQLILYRLDHDPALASQVLPLVAPSVRDSVSRYLTAGLTIASLVDPQEQYPADWRIIVPPPADELRGYFVEAEAASGIPWPYFAAIAAIETRMGRIRGDSTAGAQGPMQFLPATWATYGGGGDIHDFRDSVLAAARLLQANGAPGDMRAALFSYNHSDSYVQAIQRTVDRIQGNERLWLGTYHWQVLYKHVNGLTLLPEGWPDVPEQIVAPLAEATPATPTGMQTIEVTEANRAQFEELLRRAGLATTEDAEAACTSIEVYAVDFAAGDADVSISHIPENTRGYPCGGDAFTTVLKIRGGQQVGEPVSVCGDCDFDDGSLEAYRAAIAPYRGRRVPLLQPWVRDGVWGIWSYSTKEL